jgi:hypothetical protein
MKVEQLEAVYHRKDDNEPYISMDFLTRNQLSIFFRLWWILSKWKWTTFTLTIKKEAGRLL